MKNTNPYLMSLYSSLTNFDESNHTLGGIPNS